jgi:RecJ-like exonuclease
VAKADKPPERDLVLTTKTCPMCEGSGEITEKRTSIAKSAIEKHLKHHAYSHEVDPATGRKSQTPIGANCDCPRTTTTIKRSCIRCGGSGQINVWEET